MPVVTGRDVAIEYSRAGDGPAILFVQGVGAIGRAWRPQLDAFAPGHTVVAIDNRGIGGSQAGHSPLSIDAMAADVLAVADHAGLPAFDLVGHSMGGIIAQEVALRAPSRVRSLALLCTFARGAQGARLSWDLLVAGMRSRIGPRASRRKAFVELVMTHEYLARVDRGQLDRDLADLFGHDLADQPSIVMTQLKAMSCYDALDRLQQLRAIPTLVVSATHDRIALPAFGRQLAGAIGGARYVEIAEAGHAAPIQCADRVNTLLREHLAATAATKAC